MARKTGDLTLRLDRATRVKLDKIAERRLGRKRSTGTFLCGICKGTDLHQMEEKHTITVQLRGGPVALVVSGVPAMKCGKCGEGFFELADLSRADLLAAAELANRGIQEGAAFRFMRKAAGLRGADVAALLNVREATISRWENDHDPVDLAAWAALAAIVSEKLAGQTTTIDRLRASRAPREATGPVRLRLAHA
jgi:YgiT-type zinc finger domain-containing protein